MQTASVEEIANIENRQQALENSVERGRSRQWQLQLWSRLIRARDGNRCVNCSSTERIQAHHVIRKALLPAGALDPGNGVTLCGDCHRKIHAEFNRKPDPNLPMGAEQGDDQNEWSYLFGLLMDDATSRGLSQPEFYHLNDSVLRFSVAYQGCDDLLESVANGELSRLRFMHEIWRMMPVGFYTNLATDIAERYLLR